MNRGLIRERRERGGGGLEKNREGEGTERKREREGGGGGVEKNREGEN